MMISKLFLSAILLTISAHVSARKGSKVNFSKVVSRPVRGLAFASTKHPSTKHLKKGSNTPSVMPSNEPSVLSSDESSVLPSDEPSALPSDEPSVHPLN